MSEISNEYKFDCGYILWYHSIEEDSWSKDSYVNLCKDLPGNVIINAIQLWSIYKELKNNFTAGMFFLMREGIMPMWEDPNNLNGGYWSFKVSNKYSNTIWKKITAGLVGNSLTVDNKNMKYITGISISPKTLNCVMKIWNNNSVINNASLFTKEIDYLKENTLRYNKHN
jgi:hypothetical protein